MCRLLLVLVLLHVHQEESFNQWLHVELVFHLQALSMHVGHVVEDEAVDA